MSDNEPEIDEAGRNETQQRIDEELAEEGDAPVDVERGGRTMSETIPEDPDRGDDAIEGEDEEESESE